MNIIKVDRQVEELVKKSRNSRSALSPPAISELMESIERAISAAELTQTHVLVVDDELKILAILRALLIP